MSDDNTPATKGDLAELRTEMTSMKDEIIRHFDVVAENIRHDLEGANKDEIEVLKDGKTDHEQRIVNLEQLAGMRA
jgi:hypothetical protein